MNMLIAKHTESFAKDTLTPEILKESINKVLEEPSYTENIKKINESFKEAGGYKKAVEEIFKYKREKNVFRISAAASMDF